MQQKDTERNRHKFNYRWNLADGYPAKGIKHHGSKAFGTFICGGGSTMGYKLAGFDHLGGVEIDPEVADVYRTNHKPKHLFVEDIRLFRKRADLPAELFNLDLLDGSPPCSTFSMAGSREDAWGKKKKFREGQADQTLDDLFFDYIELAKRLQPKVVLAENVKGLIQGNAKAYVHEIGKRFKAAGYKVQLFLLNAASMGVPQRRERVFFICQREDLGLPDLRLRFDEPAVTLSAMSPRLKGMSSHSSKIIGMTLDGSRPIFKCDEYPANTITGTEREFDVFAKRVTGSHFEGKDRFTNEEITQIGSFPIDYDFSKLEPRYLIGMSVPPVMTAQIAHQIWLQWLSKLK